MDVDFKFHGLEKANMAMAYAVENAPEALVGILTEAGLFGERETKLRTRVRTGRARASIGHFTRADMTSEATAEDIQAARAAAYYKEPAVNDLEVSWGSRVVYVPVLNYRLGDLMFEKGLQAVIDFLPEIIEMHLKELFP